MSSVGISRQALRRLLLFGVRELCEALLNDNARNKNKRKWVRDWIGRRHKFDASITLMKELASEDLQSYYNIMRLAVPKFNELLELVTPLIKKSDTVMREAIPCRTKLEITLGYLASGDSLKSLQYLFRVPHNSISNFLPVVLRAISQVLEQYMKVVGNHNTEAEWENIMQGFEDIWNFPNCCGAIDGKHVQIRRPPNSTSQFFNYKGTYSIVLFALVDADYCFRYIDVGSDGRASDSTIFKNSTLNIALEKNALNWPEGGVLVGDDIFPLGSNLLKPYSQRNLTIEQRIFNYRLSRARRVVENAFGILATRFRLFSKPIDLNVDTTELVVKACCSINNWLRMTSGKAYLPPGSVDEEDIITCEIARGSWRDVPTALHNLDKQYKSNHYAQDREDIRKAYSHAFMTHMARKSCICNQIE